MALLPLAISLKRGHPIGGKLRGAALGPEKFLEVRDREFNPVDTVSVIGAVIVQ
ncbi:MAG TPA: hypothetical protein VKS22_10660 [Candidatus Binataceae bacterium]|nr:hypothetical protein [Candidatus Binataceae bacterium]